MNHRGRREGGGRGREGEGGRRERGGREEGGRRERGRGREGEGGREEGGRREGGEREGGGREERGREEGERGREGGEEEGRMGCITNCGLLTKSEGTSFAPPVLSNDLPCSKEQNTRTLPHTLKLPHVHICSQQVVVEGHLYVCEKLSYRGRLQNTVYYYITDLLHTQMCTNSIHVLDDINSTAGMALAHLLHCLQLPVLSPPTPCLLSCLGGSVGGLQTQ